MKVLFALLLLWPCALLAQTCPGGESFNGLCVNNPQGATVFTGQTGTAASGQGGTLIFIPGAPNSPSTAVGSFIIQMDPNNSAVNFTCSNPTSGGVGTATCSFNGISFTVPLSSLPTQANNTVLGNFSGSTASPVALDPLAVTNMLNGVIAVQYSAIANVSTLSGAQLITVPGGGTITPATGTIVLLTGQTTLSQNGLWVVNSGAWTRPAMFPSGDVIPANCNVTVRDNNTGTIFSFTPLTPLTIDTSNQSWTVNLNFYGIGTSPITIAGANNSALGQGVSITGGTGATPGAISLTAGAANGASGNSRGANVNITAGLGAGTGNGTGGQILGTAGNGGPSAVNDPGGSIIWTAGNGGSTGNGAGGKSILKAGVPGGTGALGIAALEDANGLNQVQVTNNGPAYIDIATASLPSCAVSTKDVVRLVNDALTPTLGGTLTGGGAVWVWAACNGTNWVVL